MAAKRIGAILLAMIFLFIVFAVPLAQPAKALAGAIVVGAVIAAMAVAGITIVATGITSSQLQVWVEGKLDEWATDMGSPLDHLINTAGIGVTISGLLTIGTSAYNGISNFINWLRNDLSLTNNQQAEVVYQTGSEYSWLSQNQPLPVRTSEYSYNTVYLIWEQDPTSSYELRCASTNSSTYCASVGDYVYFMSDSQFTVYFSKASMGEAPFMEYYYTAGYNSSFYFYRVWTYYGPAESLPDSYLGTVYMPVFQSEVECANAFNDFLDGINPPSDYSSIAIGTGTISVPTVTDDERIFIDVGALPGSTVTEVADGVITDVTENELTVSGEVSETEPEYEITGPEQVLGIEDVFPFCIPFDLYNFFQVLDADPVAPVFTWRFYVENLVDYTFEIDLSVFDDVAAILRTMFLLLFCIGLAAVTRDLLRS